MCCLRPGESWKDWHGFGPSIVFKENKKIILKTKHVETPTDIYVRARPRRIHSITKVALITFESHVTKFLTYGEDGRLRLLSLIDGRWISAPPLTAGLDVVRSLIKQIGVEQAVPALLPINAWVTPWPPKENEQLCNLADSLLQAY